MEMTMNVASHSDRRMARIPLPGTSIARWDSISVGLVGVFLVAAIFYAWTAATSQPLGLHSGPTDRYNLLASAFLHLHLSVGSAPSELLHLKDPYNPAENLPFVHGPTDATSLGDDLLYHGNIYFLWGVAPALVLLVPLHLLGFEPSASVTVSVFAIAGLGFALATLRVLIRQIGNESLWMCILAGFAVALSSVVPFLLRTPGVTEDTLAGGYCFMMAGVWLAMSAIASKQASLVRLVLMSLCFGLAAGSRPVLILTGLVLIPVYKALRSSRTPHELLITLASPVGACCLLLLAYNQARFNQPLEFGVHYQLAGIDTQTAPAGHLGYILPGAWIYTTTLPHLSALFPFVLLVAPSAVSPSGLPPSEITGGLLPMAPIVVFVIALPWLWRRRPARLGRLATPLMILSVVGVLLALVPSYQYFSSTERYEVEFASFFVLGGVAAWLALSLELRGYQRRLLQAGGGLLATWGCIAGLAISLVGYGNFLAVNHPSTWHTLEDLSSPLSSAIETVVGHPASGSVASP